MDKDPYLELLKRTLTFSLWEDPGVPLEWFQPQRGLLKAGASGLLSRSLRPFGLEVVRRPFAWPRFAETMVPLGRLDHLEQCLRKVAEEGIAGDVIETGVWRGGCCIFMRACLDSLGEEERTVWVADSFGGLPSPEESSHPEEDASLLHLDPVLNVPLDVVKANFEKYGPFKGRVSFLPGWFHDTLKSAPLQRLALLRLDGDLYSSTMDALVPLYPKLSPGGFVVLDDFHLAGCRRAAEEYLASVGDWERIQIEWIDEHAVSFRKPEPPARRREGES